MANRSPTLHKETPLKVNTISLVQLLTTFFATIIAPAVFAVDSFKKKVKPFIINHKQTLSGKLYRKK